MVGSTRAELASSSLDGPAFASGYPSGPRGSYSSPSLERSGSFRESLENRLMASASGTSRNASASLDIPSLSQYLPLEPFSTSELNLKYSRQGELRRALGVSVEEHSFGSLQSKTLPQIASEDLKRFKASVLETSNRARDRAKLLQESILKLDKYRNIVTKRRSRNEAQTSEKPGSSNLLKMGSQIHQSNSDIANVRQEERTKLAIPNRRVRSSMAEVRSDGRSSIPARQGAAMDKDKNMLFEKEKSMLRVCNGGPMSSEDRIRGLPTGGDGWEKKLKRKRSVGTMGTRIPDGEREFKHTIQSRPNTEPRSRPPDGNGFRSGSANGVVGSSKIDNNSQLSGNSSRGMTRTELENGSLPTDRRDRIIGLDKERIMAKGSNKLNNREDAQPESQSPLAKGKASRAPRTGSGTSVGAPNYPRLSGGIEGWEHSACLNKVQPLSSPVNRKRPLPTGSSSPPVTQWVGQRPQKISRTRRANVVSPVSNFDDVQAFSEGFVAPDVGARLSSVDSGSSLNSRVAANGSHQLKIRLENVPSPAGLSESEESGVIENKREKGGDNCEVEDGHPNVPLKVSDFSLPMKKNKIRTKEEIGDGVRRQGRSGRGSTLSKASLSLTKEKQENADAIKPLKNGRPAPDRSESRVGRPPSKKVSDRKAYGRPMPSIHCGPSDLIGEPDDDREELLTAVNATRNSSYNSCSSSFWKSMETVFSYISSEDLTFVKHQIKFAEELDGSLSSMLDTEHNVKGNVFCGAASSIHSTEANILGTNSFTETFCSVDDQMQPKEASRKTETENWFDRIIPLSQRLLSALIMEDGTDGSNCCIEQEGLLLQLASDCSTYGANCYLENELELGAVKSDFELDLDYKNQKNCAADVKSCNGFAAHSNRGTSVIQTSISGGPLFQENGVSEHLDVGALSEYGLFEHMPLNDRILMELHSIGIYPDLVPGLAEGEDEEIDKVISDLKMRFFQQVRKIKSQLYNLEKALHGVKEVQERKIEQLAMHKLVEMAYKKLTGGRGSHGSSHKSGVSKISKQLAMDFAKRTLIRCQKFEETGQSCFSEPPMRDMLFSVLQHGIETRYLDGLTSNNAERHGHKSDRGQFVPFQGPSNIPDQPFGKNDPFSNRGKKKEVLLDDVVTSAASRAASSPYNTIPVGSKWKKSDKDKDHSRDTLVKNPGAKAGRPSLSGSRGERKTKTKPKQKIAQLSTSGNGLGRPSEPGLSTSGRLSSSNNGGFNMNRNESKPSNVVTSDLPKDLEDSIFTNLPLNGMNIDELDVQGQDIGSWLNVDEDALQDHDLVGLEIPMDDLSDLKLNF
ncbi:uncharacterized protein LOC110096662 isoform X1 [Dendrobium catenatum]|uniref:uncharacterized protein LOC110096662 isoform X1 n=1 Tax=Dendrobium catenatum TaxID=906689 RepID=UPI0009F27C9C|nr:uncharacterized protein LOC110096662 isoform X1 [Dendrobium catenatum]XP_028556298.1 uncharacterized protein LOC110096662 isoform X1 [Dendrobium catenatum]